METETLATSQECQADDIIKRNRVKAYLVGGAVRDKLMGGKTKDFDYVVEAPNFEAMEAWIKERGTIFVSHPEFWVVRAHINGKQPADYALARRDGLYSDGRRPDSVEPATLLQDLSRRDFTVNAIAYDEETGEYIDPYGGRADLKKNLLRCVGKPEDRFQEDALRMLRALRFAITKGFDLDDTVADALCSFGLCELLRTNISVERKRDELERCFRHDTPHTLEYLKHFEDITHACFGDKKLWLLPTQKA